MLNAQPIPRALTTWFTPAGTIAATNVQAAIEELDGDIQGLTDADEQTAAEVPYTPTAPHTADNVQDAIDDLQSQIDGLGSSYTDDDVIDVLTDVLEDGYDVEWEVTTDSVGTHLTPNRIIRQPVAEYASEITIDLSKSVGSFHTITLEGNPTLLVSNFAFEGASGKKFWLRLVQDATGGRVPDFAGSSQTWTFPDGVPAFTPTPGDQDLLEFLVVAVEPAEFLFVRSLHRPRLVSGSHTTGATITEPASYWNCDEASGVMIDVVGARDLAPSGTTGAVSGKINGGRTASEITSRFGRDDFDLVNSDDFTFAGWVRFQELSSTTSGNPFLSGVTTGGAAFTLIYEDLNNYLYFTVWNDVGDPSNVFMPAVIAIDEWHLIACSFSRASGTMRVSLDGSAWETAVLSGSPFEVDLVSALFSLNCGYGEATDFDEWGFWPSVLSNDELAGLYADGDGATVPFDGVHEAVDWARCDSRDLTINTADPTVKHLRIIPGTTLTVAVLNDGATGTLSFVAQDGVVIDWGDEGEPTLPGDGKIDLFEFFARTPTHVIGSTTQTGCTP